MTDRTFELTRRKLLGAAGAVGVAGAGAGVGTSALFSDEERFEDNTITAGTLDMSVTAEVVAASEYYTSSGDGPDIIGEMDTADGAAVVGLQASDVKPGDWVIICFEVSIGANPGYVQVSTDDFAQYENGQTDPEIDAEGADSNAGSLGGDLDGQGKGELQDELVAEVYGTYDSDSTNSPPESYLDDPEPSLSGSARTVFEQFATGVVLGGSATPLEVGSDGVERYLLLELPRDVGNEVQSDAIEFDLVFEAEQVRNNDGFEPSSDLVGYWPLNSVGDGTAADLSGNGNDGAVVGDVSPAGGQVAGAGSFDGSDDYIDSFGVGSSTDDVILQDWTVSGWIYPSDWNDDSRKEWLSISEDQTADRPLDFVHEGGKIKHYRGQAAAQVMSSDVSTESGWHHMAVTQERTSPSSVDLAMYFDASQVDTVSGDYENMRPSLNIAIGRFAGSPADRFYWDGKVDDVRVYDRALSSSEVTEIYNETN